MTGRIRFTSTLTAAAVCALLAAPTSAQDFSYGIKGGLNAANISFGSDSSTTTTNGTRAGLAIGGYVESWLKMEGWTVLAEALISQKGSTIESNGTDRSIRLTYLEVPVLLRAGVTGPRNSALQLYAGPSFALELGESRPSSEEGEPVVKEDFFKPFDVGVVIGGSIGLRQQQVTVDLRLTLGIANIADEDDFAPGVSAKNRAVSILVGWRLR